MSSGDPLDGWAEAYRLVHGPDGANVPGLTDVDGYVERARDVEGDVLVVGCGTGRIYLPLLEDGNDVYGLDRSRDQLAVLERVADRRGLDANVLRADMRSFSFDATFDLILVPYDTFRYNTTPESQLRCLSRLKEHVAPGGSVVFEFSRPEPEWSPTPRTLRTEFGYDGVEFLLITTLRLSDEIEQLLHVDEKLFGDGRLYGENTVELARIYKREFEHLLARAGFDRWTAYGDLDGTPLGEADASKSTVWEVPGPGG